MESAAVVTIIVVALIVAALVVYLVGVILQLRKITAGLDEVIGHVEPGRDLPQAGGSPRRDRRRGRRRSVDDDDHHYGSRSFISPSRRRRSRRGSRRLRSLPRPSRRLVLVITRSTAASRVLRARGRRLCDRLHAGDDAPPALSSRAPGYTTTTNTATDSEMLQIHQRVITASARRPSPPPGDSSSAPRMMSNSR